MIILLGALGRMGKIMQETLTENGLNFAAYDKDNIDKFTASAGDVIVDFSSPSALEQNLDFALKNGINILVATTGHDERGLKSMHKASQHIAVFYAPNLSPLFFVMNSICKFLPDLGYDILLEETHHNTKADKPSGSAKLLITSLKNKGNLTVCCHRLGDEVGEHTVKIYGENETLTLSHKAMSKKVFCVGAIRAAEFLADKKRGLYQMEDLCKFTSLAEQVPQK